MDAWQHTAEGRQLSALQHENTELRLQLDLKLRQLESAQPGDVAQPADAPQQPQPAGRALAPVDLPPMDAGGQYAAGDLLP